MNFFVILVAWTSDPPIRSKRLQHVAMDISESIQMVRCIKTKKLKSKMSRDQKQHLDWHHIIYKKI